MGGGGVTTVIPAWHDEAACQGMDVNLFYPVKGKKLAALKVCARCPVADLCLEYAQARSEPWGIWGGMTERERAAARRRARRAANQAAETAA